MAQAIDSSLNSSGGSRDMDKLTICFEGIAGTDKWNMKGQVRERSRIISRFLALVMVAMMTFIWNMETVGIIRSVECEWNGCVLFSVCKFGISSDTFK